MRGTKTHKLARAPPVVLAHATTLDGQGLCVPRVLACYLWGCHQPGVPRSSAVTDCSSGP
jgi:hypothetical protein